MIPAAISDAFEGMELCDACGRENCACHPSPVPGGQQLRPRLAVLRASDVISLPRPVEIIEGILWQGCITMMVSESGAGKTFVATDQGASVSAGVPWQGRHTTQGSFVYIPYESDDLGARFKALRDVRGYPLEHFYAIRASDPISPRVTRDGETPSTGEYLIIEAVSNLRDELAAAGRPPVRQLAIDTARASMTGSEDASENTSAYLRAGRRILACVPDAGLLITHHSGWQDGGDTQRKRERGSSAWRGNVDATVYLESGEYDPATGEAPLTLRTLKVRDGEKPAPLHMTRRRVEVPGEIDRYGQPVTTCVIEPDRRTREDREAERRRATEAEFRTTDLAVLQAMRDYPEATSISRLRPYVGRRTEDVRDAVTRILQAGWALDGERGKPFTLTSNGFAALNGHHP